MAPSAAPAGVALPMERISRAQSGAGRRGIGARRRSIMANRWQAVPPARAGRTRGSLRYSPPHAAVGVPVAVAASNPDPTPDASHRHRRRRSRHPRQLRRCAAAPRLRGGDLRATVRTRWRRFARACRTWPGRHRPGRRPRRRLRAVRATCARCRRRLPIIFLSARDSDFDIVAGLRLGADDYLTKDVEPAAPAARIAALFRRIELLEGAAGQEDLLERGPLQARLPSD